MRRLRLIFLAFFVAAAPAVDLGPPELVVERGSFTKLLTFTGELQAAESFFVGTPNISIWTFVISRLAPEGSLVQPGDLLIQFDTTELELKRLDLEKKREEARIKIAQKEAEIETRRQDLLLARAMAEKNLGVAELYAAIDPSFIPLADAEKYQFDLSKARLEMEKAEDRLRTLEESSEADLEVERLAYVQADLELRRVLSELDKMTVRAPLPGIVVYGENWQTGRKIQEGDTTFRRPNLLTLPNMERVLVVAYVHDVDFAHLRSGMPARVVLDAVPGREFRGELLDLPEIARPRTPRSEVNVFRVEVLLHERDLEIMKPGMTARVEVRLPPREALMVPRRALHLSPAGDTYVVPRENPAAAVPVRVLDADHRLAVVEGDLAEGTLLSPASSVSAGSTEAAVDWLPIRRQDLLFSVPGNGILRAARAVEIRPPAISNHHRFKIVRMAEEGAEVRTGDFLLGFDPTEVQKRLRDEEASLEKVRQEYERTRSSLELQIKDLELELEEAGVQRERTENRLLQAREFESILKVREAEHEAHLAGERCRFLGKKLTSLRRSSDLQLQILKDSETFYRLRVEAGQSALRSLQIEAPIDGVVIYEPNWNNEKKQVGSDAFLMETILTLPDLRTLRVEGQVAEVDAGRIYANQPVQVTLDAIPERTFSARIVDVSSIFKQASFDRPVKVLELGVELDEVDPVRMRPGMAARLQVIVDRFEQVLAVPLTALETNDGVSYVWVRERGRPVRREVRVGRDNGIVAVIEEGLVEGEEVASRPLGPVAGG